MPDTFTEADFAPSAKPAAFTDAEFAPAKFSAADFGAPTRAQRRGQLVRDLGQARAEGDALDPVRKTEPGGALAQAGLGLTAGFAQLGEQANRVLATPFRDVAGGFAPVDFLTPGLAPLKGAYSRQLTGAADVARQAAGNLEALGAATEGPDLVRKGTAALTSIAPILATAPLSAGSLVPGAVAAGLQSYGSVLGDAEEAYRARGVDAQTAYQKAILPAVASGAVTALITRLGGATGPEAIKQAMQAGTWRATGREFARQVGFEAAEEWWDQVGQSAIAKLTYRPDLTLEQAVGEATEAGLLGGLVGGVVQVARQAGPRGATPPPLPVRPPPLPLEVDELPGPVDAPPDPIPQTPDPFTPPETVPTEAVIPSTAAPAPAGVLVQPALLELPRTEKALDAQAQQIRRMLSEVERRGNDENTPATEIDRLNSRADALTARLQEIETAKLDATFSTLTDAEALEQAMNQVRREARARSPASAEPEPDPAPAPGIAPAAPLASAPHETRVVNAGNLETSADVEKAFTSQSQGEFKPGAAREQKKFLLDALDDAFKQSVKGPLEPHIREPRSAGLTPEEYGAAMTKWARENVVAEQRNRERYGTVTIEIPGDGTFEVINNTQSLREFAEKAKDFPTTLPRAHSPSLPRRDASAPTPVSAKGDRKQMLSALESFARPDARGTLDPIQHLWSDGKQTVATDGRRMLIVKEGLGGTARKPKVFTKAGSEQREELHYPRWQQVLPTAEAIVPAVKGVDTAKLFTLVKQAEGVLTEASTSLKLWLNPDRTLGISSVSDVGEYAHNQQPKAVFLGAVNASYLRDVAQAARKLGSEKVDVSVAEIGAEGGREQTPIIFSGKGWQAIIMPMRVDAEVGWTRKEVEAITKLSPPSSIMAKLDSAIEALKTDPTKLQEGVSGLPVWLTRESLRGALIVVRQAVRAGRAFAQAVQEGVAWLAEQNLAGFNAVEAQATLESAFLDEPGVREHVGKRLLQSDFSPAAKAAIERLLLHEVKPDAQLFAEAGAVLEAVGGPLNAEASYWGNPWGLPEDAHVVLGFAIGNGLSTLETQARAAGDVALASRLAQTNADFSAQFVQQSTETARTLRAYRYFDLVGNFSPFTADAFARKVIEQAGAKERQRLAPTVNEAAGQLDQVNRQTIEQTTKAPDVQQTAATVINQTIEADALKPGTPLQQAITAEVIAQLQRSGKLTAVEAEIVRTHFAGSDPATTLAQKLERAQVPRPQQRAKQIEAEYVGDVNSLRAGLRKRLARARDGKIDASTLDAVDQAIRVRLRQMQVKLGALVRQHWTQQERVGQSLADSLVKEAGLTAEAAAKLSAAILRRFKQLAQAKKEAVLRNLTKSPAARQLQRKSVADRLIEASNLGALDTEQLWQLVAEKLGLPSYTREASAEVKRLADRAQQLPEGSVQRQEATARLMRFIARRKGVNLGDVGWAMWYANTLSGPLTHLVNTTSNVLSLLGNTATQMRDVAGVPRLLAAVGKGFKTGGQEARAILRQGPSANRTKFVEQGQALENLQPGDFTGAGLVRHWRVVARALAAADAAFYFPAREAKAITLARALAKQEGRSGSAIATRAQEILDGTEQQQNEWGAQVDRERAQLVALGEQPDATWTARRLEQLREAAWSGDVAERADDFALRVTYNNRPYGLLGAAADVFKFAQRKVPVFRAVVPFVNIVANVTNDSLNYTPWGFARGLAAAQTGVPSVNSLWSESLRKGQTPLTPDAVADLHAKAFLGTVLFGAVLARALAGLDDDDGENFQLFGKGPEDANARKALRSTGWIPYSVRLNGRYYSIANTPLAIPLGAAGNYLDAARYDKRFNQADAFNRFAVALYQVPHVIAQQSFIDSAARLAGWVESPRGRSDQMGDRALAEVLRSTSSVVVPNALRQLDRLTDPTLYDAKGIEGALTASIPFARRNGAPALNAFGEPVTSSPWSRFASDAEPNLWRDLARRNVYPTLPEKAKNAQGREMTDEEHYRYVQEAGAAVKRRLEAPGMRQQIKTAKEADLRKTITGIVKDEREHVRSRLGF